MAYYTQPIHEVVKKETNKTSTPIPKYSHTTLLFPFPRKTCVVRPTKTYIVEDNDKDQIVVGIGQKEKLIASSAKTQLRTKLCINTAGVIKSSIEIIQRD